MPRGCYEWIFPIKPSFFFFFNHVRPPSPSLYLHVLLCEIGCGLGVEEFLPLCFIYVSSSLQLALLPFFPLRSLISPVFQDKRELRVAVELQTGCHGDCQRLCVSTVCVFVFMCVSHAIMEAVSEAGRLTVSCLSNYWRQIDQCCCFVLGQQSV